MSRFQNRIIGSGEEPLDQIQFNPRNWRVHPLNQQNALKGVLDEVGWVQEVIINQRTGNLIDGHLRCQLAAREGAKSIPVKYVDLSEEEEALILSTLDPIAAMATTDKQKLDELFADIETENSDVLKMLDDIAEKERLEYAKKDPVDAEPQIDRAAELNEKWQVQTGDLWQIGEHRLLCGDSTKREDVERVMAGEKADMVFTDPPYGMNLDVSHSNDIGKKDGWVSKPKNYSSVIGDNDDFTPALINTIFDNFNDTKEVFIFGADYFSNLIPNRENGSWIVWDKRAGIEDLKLTFSEFELCWSKVKHLREIARVAWSGLLGTEQEFDHKRYHPTQKPIKLSTWFVDKYSKANETIIDLYAGAGGVMVACQNLNRKCRAIEISPNYCAVILERMQTAFPELEITRID